MNSKSRLLSGAKFSSTHLPSEVQSHRNSTDADTVVKLSDRLHINRAALGDILEP